MPVVSAAARNHIHLPARVPAVLGAVTVGRDLEFLNGIHRGFKYEAVHILIVVIHAVQQKVVVFLPPSIGVHGERIARGEFGILDGRQYAGRQQRKLQKIAFIKRQAVDPALVDHCAQIAAIPFAGRGLSPMSVMLSRLAAIVQVKIDAHIRVHRHLYALLSRGKVGRRTM